MDANVVHIGKWRSSDAIVESFPMNTVLLRTSPSYRDDTYVEGVVPEKLDSTNMKVRDNWLYYSGEGVEEDDVRVQFTIASDKMVSVVAAVDETKRLVPWASSQEKEGALIFTGYKLGLVEAGRVSAADMLSHASAQFKQEAMSARANNWLLTWLGMFLLLFPRDTSDICCRSGGEPQQLTTAHYCSAFCRAGIASVIVFFVVVFLVSLAFHACLAFIALVVLLGLALAWHRDALRAVLWHQAADVEASLVEIELQRRTT